MKGKITKFLIVIAFICTAFFGVLPLKTVQAVDGDTIEIEHLDIVALGDSISTGYGLSETDTKDSPSLFLNIIKDDFNASLINYAVNGYKAVDVYNQISNNIDIDTDLASATTILVSTGGNDLLQPLMSALQVQLDAICVDPSNPTESEFNQAAFALMAQQDEITLLLNSAIEKFTIDFAMLSQEIETINPTAQVIYQTLYNPAVKSADFIISQLYNFLNPFVQHINSIISAEGHTYDVADVYTSFEDYDSTELLTNIEEYDIHPNAKGNEVIADTINVMIDYEEIKYRYVDVKIFTNNVWVNEPVSSETTSSGEVTTQAAGGEVSSLEADGVRIKIKEGEKLIINIANYENFVYSKLIIDNVPVNKTSTYTINTNTDNVPDLMEVYFLEKFTTEFSIGYYGKINVDSTELANTQEKLIKTQLYGDDVKCNIIPDFGYEIASVKVDDEETEDYENNSYAFDSVDANHTLHVDFAKIEKTLFIDNVTDISLEASTDILQYGSTLAAEKITSGVKYQSIKSRVNSTAEDLIIYKFSIYSNSGFVVTPLGAVTIKIPMPTNIDKDRMDIYFINDLGEAEKVDYSIDQDDMIVLSTDKFSTYSESTYAISETQLAVKSFLWLIILCSSIALIAIITTIIVVIKVKKDKKLTEQIREENKIKFDF